MSSFWIRLAASGALALLSGCVGQQSPFAVPSGVRRATAPVARPADRFTAIYSFQGGSNDGAYPNGGLTNVFGKLYGTTAGGGPTGAGTVYSITAAGSEKPVHIFGGDPDGDDPWPPPIALGDKLYGTTAGGGSDNAGAVYQIGPRGERVLYSFAGGADGTEPIAGLVAYHRKLYGATLYGGSNGDGTLAEITASGKERVLHTFGGSDDGTNPYTTVTPYGDVLYGTAVNGGAYGGGTVYTVSPSGGYATLHNFGGTSGDGVSPRGALVEVDGTLYGTTEFGGAYGQGTVYEITPFGVEHVLHSFGKPDAEDPTDGLLYWHHEFYGTGYQGGGYSVGAVFEIDLKGREKVLHSFTYGADGAHPWGTLVEAGGSLFGTASLGGSRGIGTVYRITP